MKEEFEIKNTLAIQMSSLKQFMTILGYDYYGVGRVFYSDWESNKTQKWISFGNAVKLHNGNFFEWHGKYFDPPFDGFSVETIQEAMKAKLVYFVKLQNSYKKGVIVQSHVVKFLDKENVSLFIP